MNTTLFIVLQSTSLTMQLASGGLSTWTARRWRKMGYEGLATFNTGLAIFMLNLAAWNPLLH